MFALPGVHRDGDSAEFALCSIARELARIGDDFRPC